jgi:KDO2-lipid IV(A) lauroyltransferase
MAQFTKNIRDGFTQWPEVLAVWMFQKIIPLFPLKASYALARGLATLSLPLLQKQRKTILGNMDVAFGQQMSTADKTDLARKMATDMFKGFFECFYLSSIFRSKVKDIAHIEGRHHLDEALARGKGVITLSAHFGNFIILGSIMLQEGYPFHMVLKDPPSKPLARLFQKFRRSAGQRWITTTPWRECQKKIFHCLRRNEIICLIADEYKRRGGVEVDFFGYKTPTAVGPAVLSLRTGAALVPLFMVRQKDDTHKIIIEPALEFTLTGNQAEDIYHITSAFTQRIEWYIRKYPSQWLWLNRRWKKLSLGDKHHQEGP